MDIGPERMQGDNEFEQVLQKYEDMLKSRKSYFFDIGEFEEIIDYYLDVREFREAGEAAKKALRQHPNSYEIRIKLVHIQIESGNSELALETLNNFAEYEKDDSDYFLLKGTALVNSLRFKEAEKAFDIALKKNSAAAVDIYINISIAFENARQYNYALKYLGSAYMEEPENLTVLYDLGYYYERVQNFKASIEFYNKFLDVDPYSENVWYNLGVIHSKVNNLDKAIECYDFAISINPSYGSAYFNKANIYANQDNYSTAIDTYIEFLEIEPENLQAWSFLGECYEETGDHEKALEIYSSIIEMDNTFADGWYGAGLALMHTEKLTEAASYVLKALDFESENPEYWFTLADIYSLQSLLSEAVKCYAHVCKLDSSD